MKKSNWTNDVRAMLPRVGRKFTVKEFCAAVESDLQRKHPENNNVRAKIRQQLQVLRDNGELRQGKTPGTWHKL